MYHQLENDGVTNKSTIYDLQTRLKYHLTWRHHIPCLVRLGKHLIYFNGVFTERSQIIYCQLIFLMVGFRVTSEIKLNVFFNGVFTERAQIIYCQLIFLMVGFRVKSEIKLNDLPHTP